MRLPSPSSGSRSPPSPAHRTPGNAAGVRARAPGRWAGIEAAAARTDGSARHGRTLSTLPGRNRPLPNPRYVPGRVAPCAAPFSDCSCYENATGADSSSAPWRPIFGGMSLKSAAAAAKEHICDLFSADAPENVRLEVTLHLRRFTPSDKG